MAVALVAGSSQAIGAVPAEYTFLDLGTFGGTKSQAFGINNAGQVVGFAKDAAWNNFAFRTAPNSVINPATDNLGSLASGYGSFAYAINDAGQVVGQGGTPSGDRAWQYGAAGTMTNLGTLGGDWSYAYAVNATGQVTGGAARPAMMGMYPTHAFLYSGGTMYGLGTLGGTESYGTSINSGGTVVGYSAMTPAPGGYASKHAFVWRPNIANGTAGTMTDLGTLGGLESYAYDINDAGQIVGGSNVTTDVAYHAFLRTAGTSPAMLDLGTLGGNDSEAKSINAKGQLVGWADAADGTVAAFVYGAGRMRNLNGLAAGAAGWALSHAEAVNDAGQIAGYGVAPDGQTRGFLLSPIPTWAVNAGGAWSDPANWSTPAAPNAPAATANLASVITAAHTITLDASATLGELNFAAASPYTISGPGTLTIDGGPRTIRVYQGTHEIAVPLDVGTGGASIVLDDAAGLKLSGIVTGSLASLSLGTGARLDLAGSSLTVAKGGVTLANVVNWLAAGYNGGDWNGAGITSTPAAQDPQRVLALGWRDDATSVTILPARFGDANLDGVLNADDYALLDRGMAVGLAGWTNGDFNYDGSVTTADYLLIDRSFALQTGSLSPDLLTAREARFGSGYVDELVASVPEPTTGAVLCLIAGIAARRRPRQSAAGLGAVA